MHKIYQHTYKNFKISFHLFTLNKLPEFSPNISKSYFFSWPILQHFIGNFHYHVINISQTLYIIWICVKMIEFSALTSLQINFLQCHLYKNM